MKGLPSLTHERAPWAGVCDERRHRSRRAAAQQQVDQSALPEVEQQEEEEHGGAGGEQQQQQQQQQQHQCHVRRTSAVDPMAGRPGVLKLQDARDAFGNGCCSAN